MPAVKSVTIMAFANTGSRFETKEQQGIAHFFEHMVFKGTDHYATAQDLAMAVDSVGANFNAFTSKEYTGYYVHSASKHFSLALDVVSDMIQTPLLRQEDIDREKGVIIEEINMYVDSPMRHIANLFEQMAFRGSGLEHDILGTKETVSAFDSDDFNAFLKEWYGHANLVVVVAGDDTLVGSDETARQIVEYFNKSPHTPRNKKAHRPQASLNSSPVSPERFHLEHRQTEQAHFVLGWPGLARGDERRYALGLLNTIIGANMSSRLFSEVREQRGLCYYINSSVDQYHDGGIFGASAGVDPKRVEEAIKVTLDEFAKVGSSSQPITDLELSRAKEYLAGKLVLGLEDSESVAQFFGLKQLMLGELLTPTQVLAQYRKVTLADVREVASQLLVPDQVKFAMIGPFEEPERFAKIIGAK